MEEQHPTMVGSLNNLVWGAYLERFVEKGAGCNSTSQKSSTYLNITKGNYNDVICKLEESPNCDVVLIYWPLEIYPLVMDDFELDADDVKDWFEAVSQYVVLRREFRNRVRILNAFHLFADFIVDDTPSEACTTYPLLGNHRFWRYILAKESMAENSEYSQFLDTLYALEVNKSHSKIRIERLSEYRLQFSIKMEELVDLQREKLSLLTEHSDLKLALEKSENDRTIAFNLKEQLEDQISLLQEALENQLLKSTELNQQYQEAMQKQEHRFQAESKELKNSISSLSNEKAVEHERYIKLKQNLSDKEALITQYKQEIAHILKHNSRLEEQLVQVQIYIEKIHEKCAKQLGEADNSKIKLKQALSHSEKVTDDLRVKLSALEEQCKEQSQSLEKSTKTINTALEKENSLRTELSQVKSSLAKATTELTEKTRLLDLALEKQNSIQEELSVKSKFLLLETMQKQRTEQKLNSKLANVERALNKSEATRSILAFELNQLKESSLWKLALPAKALKGRIFGNEDKFKDEIALLYTSNLFDAKWYMKCYQDVLASGIDPAEHYLKFGFKEGRNPSPAFDGNWYLSHYHDVAEKGFNPLIHYIKYGQGEGRRSSPMLLERSEGS